VAIALVGQTTGAVAATTSTTFSYTATAGHLLVIFVARTGGLATGALSGVTDSASQTWSLATIGAVSGSSDTRIECWYIANTANITSVTLNSTASQTYAWNLTEWSGAATSSVLDVASPNPSGQSSGTAVVTPSITTTGSTDLVLAAVNNPNSFGDTFNAGGSAPTTGWMALTGFNGPSNITVGVGAYQVMSATGSYHAAWTLGSSDPAGTITVAFKAPAATIATPSTAGVAITANEPVTGSGNFGFSGIQGIGIQGASVQGLQAGGSTTNAPAGLATVTVTSPAVAPTVYGIAPQATTVTATANPAVITTAFSTGEPTVSPTANNPTVSVVANAGLATVTVTGITANQDYASPGEGTVTVTANAPKLAIVANAGQAQVAVNSFPPSGFASQPTVAPVTVTAQQATPQVTAAAGLASVTVTANSTTQPAAAGLATVTVTASNTSAFSVTAAAGLADPTITANQPTPQATVNAGLASVTVTANAATGTGNFTPGTATVIVTANPVTRIGGAGQPQVTITATGPTPTVTAQAGRASVTATASGVSKPIIPITAQVTVTANQVIGGVISAAQLAQCFAAGINVGTLTPAAIVPYNGLMLFETPQIRDRPPYLPDSSQRQIGLMRHYENRLRGVNVWKRSDGTYCVDTICNYEAAQTHPAAYFSDDPIGPDLTATEQGLSDSNISYPWNPYPGSTNSEIPGSYAYNTNFDQTTQEFILDPYLVKWWQGGAENIVLQSQAIELTMAGFGDCLTVAPPGATYTPHSYKGNDNQ
jgi:hypothetical protein